MITSYTHASGFEVDLAYIHEHRLTVVLLYLHDDDCIIEVLPITCIMGRLSDYDDVDVDLDTSIDSWLATLTAEERSALLERHQQHVANRRNNS